MSDSLMLKSAIIDVVEGRFLESYRAEAVMNTIMDGEATPGQIAGLLVALRIRGEAVAETVGFARAMRAHVTPVSTSRRPLIDTCGTGGGGYQTINVSTAAAIVAAGAGVAVAKHGNRAMTSRCGSADVLAKLGINLDLSPDEVGRCIDDIGIGFLFAPLLHPAMKHAVAPRRDIGVRTVFNLLGPLTNPAGAQAQVIGVPELHLTDLVIEVLAELGVTRAMVVHGMQGVDELSIDGPTRICELRDGWIRKYEIEPEDVGLEPSELCEVEGGDAQANAAALEAVFRGEHGARRDFVVLNAAAALVVADAAADLREGVATAQGVVDSGAAWDVLERWRAWPEHAQASSNGQAADEGERPAPKPL